MIAPVDYQLRPDEKALREPRARPALNTVNPTLDSARELISRHPVIALAAGVAIGITAAWIIKRKTF